MRERREMTEILKRMVRLLTEMLVAKLQPS